MFIKNFVHILDFLFLFHLTLFNFICSLNSTEVTLSAHQCVVFSVKNVALNYVYIY